MTKIIKKEVLPISIIVIILFINMVSAISDSVYVDIINTRDLKIDFVPVDGMNPSFEGNVSENIKFMNLTYPLSNTGLDPNINKDVFYSSIGESLEDDEIFPLLARIYKSGRISKSTDRVVGIVPDGWFGEHGRGEWGGVASLRKFKLGFIVQAAKGVIVEEDFRHGAAHEVGHTLGLCDEYSIEEWNKLNSTLEGCPNGDSDNDGNLDLICLEYPEGCPTSTFGKLVPWNNTNGTVYLHNFMGTAYEKDARWITKDTYIHLSDTLSSFWSFLSVDYGILITGTANKNGTINIDTYSYILDEQSILNESSEGNYTVVVEENGSILHEIDFEPEFAIFSIGGNFIEVNTTTFVFVLPFSDNVTRIYVEKNNVTKDEINRSANTPPSK